MEPFNLKKEIVLWAIIIAPIIYLISIWQTLPEIVPTHFGADGKPNDYSHKSFLMGIIIGINLGIYLLLYFIPKIDAKKQLKKMGAKYFLLRLLVAVFIAALSFFIVYSTDQQQISFKNQSLLFVIIGGFFAVLGNYMQTVKPNYFIGIRTPWTLENDEVWRKTHQVGGKAFLIGGILIMILAMFTKTDFVLGVFPIVLSISIFTTFYSYWIYRQERKKTK